MSSSAKEQEELNKLMADAMEHVDVKMVAGFVPISQSLRADIQHAKDKASYRRPSRRQRLRWWVLNHWPTFHLGECDHTDCYD